MTYSFVSALRVVFTHFGHAKSDIHCRTIGMVLISRCFNKLSVFIVSISFFLNVFNHVVGLDVLQLAKKF